MAFVLTAGQAGDPPAFPACVFPTHADAPARRRTWSWPTGPTHGAIREHQRRRGVRAAISRPGRPTRPPTAPRQPGRQTNRFRPRGMQATQHRLMLHRPTQAVKRPRTGLDRRESSLCGSAETGRAREASSREVWAVRDEARSGHLCRRLAGGRVGDAHFGGDVGNGDWPPGEPRSHDGGEARPILAETLLLVNPGHVVIGQLQNMVQESAYGCGARLIGHLI